jgi:hypothetical protein
VISLVSKKEKAEMEDAFWFMVGAYNPIGFLDFGSYTTERGRAQKAVGLGTLYAVVYGASALSGGGATPQRIRDVARVGWRTIPALKVDSYRAVVSGAVRTGRYALMGAARSGPVIGVGLMIYSQYRAIGAWWDLVQSLDWVPDLYQIPGGH